MEENNPRNGEDETTCPVQAGREPVRKWAILTLSVRFDRSYVKESEFEANAKKVGSPKFVIIDIRIIWLNI